MVNKRIKTLFQKLGEDEIIRRVGVTRHSLAYAMQTHIPAMWYVALKSMGDRAGVDVPIDLFKWRGVND